MPLNLSIWDLFQENEETYLIRKVWYSLLRAILKLFITAH